MTILLGEVKTYFSEKHYGWIKTERGPDLFFHRSDIENGDIIAAINVGQRVTLEAAASPKGPRAANIKFAD
jgi:cold shock CspA family protein